MKIILDKKWIKIFTSTSQSENLSNYPIKCQLCNISTVQASLHSICTSPPLSNLFLDQKMLPWQQKIRENPPLISQINFKFGFGFNCVRCLYPLCGESSIICENVQKIPPSPPFLRKYDRSTTHHTHPLGMILQQFDHTKERIDIRKNIEATICL